MNFTREIEIRGTWPTKHALFRKKREYEVITNQAERRLGTLFARPRDDQNCLINIGSMLIIGGRI